MLNKLLFYFTLIYHKSYSVIHFYNYLPMQYIHVIISIQIMRERENDYHRTV